MKDCQAMLATAPGRFMIPTAATNRSAWWLGAKNGMAAMTRKKRRWPRINALVTFCFLVNLSTKRAPGIIAIRLIRAGKEESRAICRLVAPALIAKIPMKGIMTLKANTEAIPFQRLKCSLRLSVGGIPLPARCPPVACSWQGDWGSSGPGWAVLLGMQVPFFQPLPSLFNVANYTTENRKATPKRG